MSSLHTVFDRRLVRLHRDRSARTLPRHDVLFVEVAERLAERLDDVRRPFHSALDVGTREGTLLRLLAGRSIPLLAGCELSPVLARRQRNLMPHIPVVCADEEFLPFRDSSFDLVVSSLALHWVNDLPGTLVQVRRILKPEGFFLAALPGGGTLFELRQCLMEAELEVRGGASPRTSPVVDPKDAAGLLQRAGFSLPVVDSDVLTLTYEHPLALLRDLQGMGESSTLTVEKRSPLRRDVLLRAMDLYRQRHTGLDGRIEATIQVVWMAGWTPSG
ncbi:MAG: methyltransferase domain-containing protein [Pseudomonadota bacterium]|nr:methyltransferase domain-containing protein [Pseudomonadota bacterium]